MTYVQCKGSSPQSLTVRFNYYSAGFGDLDSKINDSLYLTIRDSGQAQAVLYDPPSVITSVRRGTLPSEEVGRLLARLRETLKTAAQHKIDETIIREGDSFFLNLDCGTNRVGEFGGRVEDWPDSVKSLVNDLRSLWRRLDKQGPSYGYIRAVRIEKNRFDSILKEGRISFKSIRDYPPDLRAVITKAVECPLDFHDVTRVEMDKLLTHTLTITHDGSGYELLPFLSNASRAPDR
jgi:hypothetical protein